MKAKTIFLILSVFLSFQYFSADIISQKGNVNWSNPKSWDLGRIPMCSDNIIIPSNSFVTLDISVFLNKDETCDQTQLNIYGELNFQGGKKISLSKGAKVKHYKNGEINANDKSEGKFELIEIDTTIYSQEIDIKYETNKNININSKIDEYTKKSKQYFTVNAQEGGTFTSKNGTIYTFKPNSFTNEKGDLISGNVEVEIIEIQNKTDMILNHKATMGLMSDGSSLPLVSGGENYLKISQNNKDVVIKEDIEITVLNSEIDPEMEMFSGEINENDQINWLPMNSKPKMNANSYTYFQRKIGWRNIDKSYADTIPNTEIFVKLPKEFDKNNAIVYVSFDGNPNLLAELSQFENGLFTNRNAFSPVGAQIHVIAISNSGDHWISSIKAEKVKRMMIIEMYNLTANTEEALSSILKKIP